MKIAVLGAGNGGMTMAGHLAGMGHEVRIYDKFPEALKGFSAERRIRMKGVLGEKTTVLAKAGSELSEIVEGTDLVMIVVPAFAHRELAESLAPLLGPDHAVVLHPGRTGGALEFAQAFRARSAGKAPLVAEAQTLLYACRRTGPDETTVYGIKKEVAFAVLPASQTEVVAAKLRGVFPQFKAVSDVLETSLLNIGAIFHPAPTVLNASWIEAAKGGFEHYKQGIGPSVSLILERIDAERMAVARALGVSTISAQAWLGTAYGVSGKDLYSAIQANDVYSGIKAPPSLDTRYLSEDVPMSLVPLSELGRLDGAATPTMDAIIELAGIIHKTDYRKNGRTLERMGLSGLDAAGLKEFVR